MVCDRRDKIGVSVLKLYFAAPLFCKAELEFNEKLTSKIEALDYEVFLPQRDGDAVNKEPILSMNVQDRAKEIFKMDKNKILETDVFLYVLDGRIPDEGAAVALGIAYAHKEICGDSKVLVGLHTDKRASFINEKLNPMIFSSLDYIACSEEELIEYLMDIHDSNHGVK